MRKNAFVLCHDFGHPKSTIIPVLKQVFDSKIWNVCVMDRVDAIEEMINAPDLIMTFKNSISEIPDDKGNWYEKAFTFQWPKFVIDEGAGLLVVHAGFAYIPHDHPVVTKVIKGRFLGHPPMSPLRYEPVENCGHPLMEGVEPFVSQLDEHFQVEGIDQNNTNILAWSYSDNGGKMPSTWAHEVGNGRVAVILPGHANPTFEALRHPSMLRLLSNAIRWAGRVDD